MSTAIPADLPEVRGRRARCLHRSELLEQAARLRRVIAVGGTHGKTTTTAMIAHVLGECGLEPGYAVGAELPRADGGHRPNARWGSGEWMVVEADESDRSFLRLDPEVAVITNVELDHHSTYASELEVRDGVRLVPASVLSPAAPSWRGRAPVSSAAGSSRVRFGLGRRRRPAARATCEPTATGHAVHAGA